MVFTKFSVAQTELEAGVLLEVTETDEPPGTDEVPETDEPPGTDEVPETDELPGTDEVTETDELPGTDELVETGRLLGLEELNGVPEAVEVNPVELLVYLGPL